ESIHHNLADEWIVLYDENALLPMGPHGNLDSSAYRRHKQQVCTIRRPGAREKLRKAPNFWIADYLCHPTVLDTELPMAALLAQAPAHRPGSPSCCRRRPCP